MAYMGIDIGTTGTKAVVVTPNGKTIASAYREYALTFPHPGWAELNARGVWRSVCDVIREAAVQADEPVKALAFSALGEAVTPVDADGEPLDNTVIAMDNRAADECAWLGETIGSKEIYHITGQPLHPMYTLNKILWWRNHKPDIYNRTWKFLCWQDYAAFKLCGEAVIDYSLASRMWLFDIRKLAWSEDILQKTGISPEQLAETKPSGTPIRKIRKDMADELGLPSYAQVVVGGFDQPAAALGAGILKPGIAVDGLGTVECITPVLDRPITDDTLLEGNIPCNPYLVPGMYIFMGFNFTGGNLLRWYRDEFAWEEKQLAEETQRDVYDIIIEGAMKQPTSAMVLPHFLGTGTPYLNPDSRGAIFGLTLGTSRQQVARSIIEGITYEMRLNLSILEKAGVKIDELRATGGGSKSQKWLQLKADIFNKTITSMITSEGGCLAMAMQAAFACGDFATIEEAVLVFVQTGKKYSPNSDVIDDFDRRFDIYLKLYESVKDINRDFSRLEKEH